MWGFQILHHGDWVWVGTASGGRYEYQTEEEARRMAEICYPDQMREHRLGGYQTVRVQEIQS